VSHQQWLLFFPLLTFIKWNFYKGYYTEVVKKQTFILFYFVSKLNSVVINIGVVEDKREAEPN